MHQITQKNVAIAQPTTEQSPNTEYLNKRPFLASSLTNISIQVTRELSYLNIRAANILGFELRSRFTVGILLATVLTWRIGLAPLGELPCAFKLAAIIVVEISDSAVVILVCGHDAELDSTFVLAILNFIMKQEKIDGEALKPPSHRSWSPQLFELRRANLLQNERIILPI